MIPSADSRAEALIDVVLFLMLFACIVASDAVLRGAEYVVLVFVRLDGVCAIIWLTYTLPRVIYTDLLNSHLRAPMLMLLLIASLLVYTADYWTSVQSPWTGINGVIGLVLLHRTAADAMRYRVGNFTQWTRRFVLGVAGLMFAVGTIYVVFLYVMTVVLDVPPYNPTRDPDVGMKDVYYPVLVWLAVIAVDVSFLFAWATTLLPWARWCAWPKLARSYARVNAYKPPTDSESNEEDAEQIELEPWTQPNGLPQSSN